MTQISVRESALNALARREHSQQELRQKLLSKGYEPVEVENLLEALIAERLQSDERFAESYTNARIAAGFGPMAIRSALHSKGVSSVLIEAFLDDGEQHWEERLLQVWQKKYHGRSPANAKEYARQMRFLLQRGFSSEQVHRFLKKETSPACGRVKVNGDSKGEL